MMNKAKSSSSSVCRNNSGPMSNVKQDSPSESPPRTSPSSQHQLPPEVMFKESGDYSAFDEQVGKIHIFAIMMLLYAE